MHVYDSLTTDEFEKKWIALIEEFQLENQEWLVYMYSQRHRWVPAFVKDTFWAGMSTTQRSESMNAFFDGHVCQKTSLLEFAERYENALRKKVRKEEEADAKSLNIKYTCMTTFGWEKQFLEAYTNSKFKQFKAQLLELIGCTLVIGPVIDGVEHFVVHHTFMTDTEPKFKKKVKFNVNFKGDTRETYCICRMFESKGMVCAHMMEVWKHKKRSSVSDRYILKRWRKNLKRCHTKVRLSYTNWEKKPEWHRFDDLNGVFKEVADHVIYDECRTRKFKEYMKRFLEENKEDCPKQSVGSKSIVPSFVRPLPIDESVGCENFHLGDPIKVAKRGRPDSKRKESHFDKAKKKKSLTKPKSQPKPKPQPKLQINGQQTRTNKTQQKGVAIALEGCVGSAISGSPRLASLSSSHKYGQMNDPLVPYQNTTTHPSSIYSASKGVAIALEGCVGSAISGSPRFASSSSRHGYGQIKDPVVSYQNATTYPSSVYYASMYGRQHQSQAPWDKINSPMLASNFNQQDSRRSLKLDVSDLNKTGFAGPVWLP